MSEKTIEFIKEKETKNTIRYKEVVNDDEKAIIGTIYIQKSYLETCKQKNKITVTISTS